MKTNNLLVRYYAFTYGSNPSNYIQLLFGLLLAIVISPTYLLPDKLYLSFSYEISIRKDKKYVAKLEDRIITMFLILFFIFMFYYTYKTTSNIQIAIIVCLIVLLILDPVCNRFHIIKCILNPFLILYNLFNIKYKN